MPYRSAEVRRAHDATPEAHVRRNAWYAANKERLTAQRNAMRALDPTAARQHYKRTNDKRRAVNRVTISRSKSQPCMDCGKPYPPYVMDFDHRPEEKKLLAVAKMLTHSPSAVEVEIAKCDVVCANCHRERTHQRLVGERGLHV